MFRCWVVLQTVLGDVFFFYYQRHLKSNRGLQSQWEMIILYMPNHHGNAHHGKNPINVITIKTEKRLLKYFIKIEQCNRSLLVWFPTRVFVLLTSVILSFPCFTDVRSADRWFAVVRTHDNKTIYALRRPTIESQNAFNYVEEHAYRFSL